MCRSQSASPAGTPRRGPRARACSSAARRLEVLARASGSSSLSCCGHSSPSVGHQQRDRARSAGQSVSAMVDGSSPWRRQDVSPVERSASTRAPRRRPAGSRLDRPPGRPGRPRRSRPIVELEVVRLAAGSGQVGDGRLGPADPLGDVRQRVERGRDPDPVVRRRRRSENAAQPLSSTASDAATLPLRPTFMRTILTQLRIIVNYSPTP